MLGTYLACCRCYYCLLPVRLGGEESHPGHGVVEQLPGIATAEFGDLRLVHRLCADALGTRSHRHALRAGMTVRRARLERATERYESASGAPETHDRLGIASRQFGSDAWPVTWRVRKMRYAARAARRYFDSGVPDHY